MKYADWIEQIQLDITEVIITEYPGVQNLDRIVEQVMKQFFLHMIFKPNDLEYDDESLQNQE